MLKSGLLAGVRFELGGEDRPRPFLEPGLEDMLGERKLNPSKVVKQACWTDVNFKYLESLYW